MLKRTTICSGGTMINKSNFIISLFVLLFLILSCNNDIAIDRHIYGTWKITRSIARNGNSSDPLRDTIPISFLNNSLVDSIFYFYAFYENKTFEYFEIDGINNIKLIYEKGDFSTQGSNYCLSDVCNYNLIASNDSLKVSFPNGEASCCKFTVCWTEQ